MARTMSAARPICASTGRAPSRRPAAPPAPAPPAAFAMVISGAAFRPPPAPMTKIASRTSYAWRRSAPPRAAARAAPTVRVASFAKVEPAAEAARRTRIAASPPRLGDATPAAVSAHVAAWETAPAPPDSSASQTFASPRSARRPSTAPARTSAAKTADSTGAASASRRARRGAGSVPRTSSVLWTRVRSSRIAWAIEPALRTNTAKMITASRHRPAVRTRHARPGSTASAVGACPRCAEDRRTAR